MNGKANSEDFGEVISVYTTEQALEDGVLVKLGTVSGVPVLATTNCFYKAGLDNPLQRHGVVLEAVQALNKPDPEDDGFRKLRVLHKGKAVDYDCLWVIQDAQGITIMLPEDY